MAEINTSVPAGLQLVPSPRRRFAKIDVGLGLRYPVSRFRVNTIVIFGRSPPLGTRHQQGVDLVMPVSQPVYSPATLKRLLGPHAPT